MKFVVSVMVYSVAMLIARTGQVAMLVIFPLLLSPTQYGALGLFVAISALVNLLPLEVSQGLARHLSEASPEEKLLYSGTAWRFTIGVLAVAAVLALVWSHPLSRLVTSQAGILPAFYGAIAFFFATTALYFTQAQFRWEMRPRDFLWASIAQAALPFGLALAGALLAADRLAGVLLGQAAGLGLILAWSIWRLRRSLLGRFDLAKLIEMLRFSLPLVPGSFAIFLGVYAARLVINDKMALADVGLFTFASQIATIPSLAILGVQAALTPYVITHFRAPETPELVGRLFEVVVAGGLWLSLIFGLGAGPAIERFGNPAFAPATALVLILAPAYLMQNLYIFGPGFIIARRTVEQMWVSIGGGVAAVGLSYWFVSIAGLVGAALATLGSALLFLGSWLFLAGRHYPIPIRWARIAAALGWPYGPALRLMFVLAAVPAFWALGLIPQIEFIRRLQR
jgi:O-antigen/teichoic acid export membrane protein